jgi:hypothetical protein
VDNFHKSVNDIVTSSFTFIMTDTIYNSFSYSLVNKLSAAESVERGMTDWVTSKA